MNIAERQRSVCSLTAIACTLSVLALACGGTAGQSGEVIELSIGAKDPAGGAADYTTYADEFLVPEIKKRVKQETNYQVQFEEHYAGSVASAGEVLEATESGLLDIGLLQYPFEPSKLYLLNTSYYVPFSSPDPAVAIEALRKTLQAHPQIEDRLKQRFNQKLLALGSTQSYGLITTFAWNEVSELEGVKIAAAGPNLPWVKAIGAVPVQGPVNEWYTSLQTGVFEGVVNFPLSWNGFKLYEVAPYWKAVGFGAMAISAVHINMDTYNELPTPVREIVLEVSREYEEGFAEKTLEMQKKALEAAKAGGGKVSELPQEQREVWANQLPNIPNQKAKEADGRGLPGSEFISDYIRFQEAEGYEFPRRWMIAG